MTGLKKRFDRRDAFKISASLGLAAGFAKFGNVGEGKIFADILGGLKHGSLSDVAYAADAVSNNCLVHIVLIDKTQTSLFQHVAAGTPPMGADAANGVAQQLSDFRGLPLTKLFADGLVGLPEDVSLSMNVAWSKSTGNHTLVDSYVDDEIGGINSAFEAVTGGTGILGAVGFNMSSNANNSREAFMGPGKRQLTTFESVKDLADTLESSILPLQEQKTLEIVKFMDSLVTPKFEMRDRLVQLAQKIGTAVPDLRTAQALTFQNNLRALVNGVAPTMADGVMQQVGAVIALHKAGVARNFMIAVPWNDTNAGNSLTNAGGEFNADPFSMTPKIAQAMVELHKAIPNLVIVTTSDGGRSPNNGDQNPGIAFLSGASSKINHGLVGTAYSNTADLGRVSGEATFSTGTTGVTSPADWYRTALVALGHVPKEGRYVSQVIKS